MTVETRRPVRAPRLTCLPLALSAVALLAACQEPLFDPDQDRSQFDRYDGIRAQYAPPYIEDEFGRRQPNLRGRLTPKD